jgi:hypothetical protein
VQAARNASEMTASQYSNYVDRANGRDDKLKNIGVKIQPNVSQGN